MLGKNDKGDNKFSIVLSEASCARMDLSKENTYINPNSINNQNELTLLEQKMPVGVTVDGGNLDKMTPKAANDYKIKARDAYNANCIKPLKMKLNFVLT